MLYWYSKLIVVTDVKVQNLDVSVCCWNAKTINFINMLVYEIITNNKLTD